MKPSIAVPYFPGSNGDRDAIQMLRLKGMNPVPLYFHMGDEERLEKNARILLELDGAVKPGGFPYEDRLGFGIVPARIRPFVSAMHEMVRQGKPVIAFCSGNQIAHEMQLAFGQGSPYKAQLLPNVCDTQGELVTNGFQDAEPYTVVGVEPERTAFSAYWKKGDVIQSVMDHGGGRFWADQKTLQHVLDNGMVVTQYCDSKGRILDDFPVNPNGSMLNIESITNIRGNVKIGMLHNERWLNALYSERAHLVFDSMRQFIQDGCPDLSTHAKPQNVELKLKDYSYMSVPMDPERVVDIYISVLTQDNEKNTAQLFLGRQHDSIDRRKLIRVELTDSVTSNAVDSVVREIAGMNLLDGISLKKEEPTYQAYGLPIMRYEVVERSKDAVVRDFKSKGTIVEDLPVMLEQVSMPNPGGYILRKSLWKNPALRKAVKTVHTGQVWFFPDEAELKYAQEHLFN